MRLREAFADGARRIMLQAATGAGKTRIASTIIRGVCDIDRPVLFVVPAIELVDQTLAKFFAEGIHDVGIMQADHRMTARDRPVQIASVQTLMRRELPPADLVFIDEGASVVRLLPPLDAAPGLARRSLYRAVGHAMDEGARRLLRKADHRGDHREADRRRDPIRLQGVRARRIPI